MCLRVLTSRFVIGIFLIAALVSATRAVAQVPQNGLPENLAGKSVDPFQLSAGKIIVFLFIRTDCPISNRYAPAIQKLSDRFQGQASFWLVYPDTGESAAQIRGHLADFHYSIPALRDTHRSLVNRAHATITPEAAVFDSSGKLTYHGRIDNWYEDFGRARSSPTTHELELAIYHALDGKTPAPEYVSALGCYISDLK